MTETLIGGVADGASVPKTDSPHYFAGRIGSGLIAVYLRRADGRLRYDHTTVARPRRSG